MELIISLISGAVGGNVAGGLLKKISLGPLWNSVAGIVGGGLGAQILSALGMVSAGGGDMTAVLSTIAGSGVGGGVVLAIVGLIKNAVAQKAG